jgi:hypothetical protein
LNSLSLSLALFILVSLDCGCNRAHETIIQSHPPSMTRALGWFAARLLRAYLVSFLLFAPAQVRADEEKGSNSSSSDSSSEDELPDGIGGDDEEYDDDDYLRMYTRDIDDSENDCRDITETFLSCTEARERGLCDPVKASEDLMDARDACPATCGTCAHPPTETSVWVDEDCYDWEEDIRVYFTNTRPEPDDFVGIYPSFVEIQKQKDETDQTEMWLFACGNVYERCRSASGGVIFGKRGISPEMPWYYFPLSPGRYKAALMRYDGSFLAESDMFTAKPKEHSCLHDCKDAVFANEPCFESETTIYVTFENCAARNDDRIAIHAISSAEGDDDDAGSAIILREEEPLLSLDACSTQDCMGDVKRDYVSFGSSTSLPSRHLMKGRQGWPLPAGKYVASLIRTGEKGPHGRVVAQSPVFEVLGNGLACPRIGEEL